MAKETSTVLKEVVVELTLGRNPLLLSMFTKIANEFVLRPVVLRAYDAVVVSSTICYTWAITNVIVASRH